jgi:DnaJ domain
MQFSNEIINKNLYKVLGLESTASQQEISKAFRTLSREYHPDKNLGNEETAKKKYQEITEAYGILGNSDTTVRTQYDNVSPHGRYADTSPAHASQNHNTSTTQASTHASHAPPAFMQSKMHQSTSLQSQAVAIQSDSHGSVQRRPSFASSRSEQASTQQTELSSGTLTAAKGSEKFGMLTAGIGLATFALGGGGLLVIGALISLAANSVKKIEKAGLASDVLKKHKAGGEVNPKLLDEANSTMRMTMSG